MKTLKMILAVVMSLLGLQLAQAQYLVDFNTAIAVPSQNTNNPMFEVTTGWTRIAPSAEGDGYGPYYMVYSYKSSGGVDDSGCLVANAQIAPQSTYDGTIETVHDYIVTPTVEGTVTIQLKESNLSSSSYPSFVEFYMASEDGKSVGQKLTATLTDDEGNSATLNKTNFVTATIELSQPTRIAIRGQHVYYDNFTATSATLPEIKALTVQSIVSETARNGNNYVNENADGTFNVKYSLEVKNTGNVDLVAGTTENYALRVFRRGYQSTQYSNDFPVPVDIAVGETATFDIDVVMPATAISSNRWAYYDVEDRLSGNIKQGYWTYVQELAPKFVFQTADYTISESTNATSLSTGVSLGIITEEQVLDFMIWNTGNAPLTVQSVTVPTGFVLSLTEGFTLAAGERCLFTVTLPITTPGIFSGNIEVKYLNKTGAVQTYTLPLSGTVADPSKNLFTFDDGAGNAKFPENSIHPDGVYISHDSETDNYYLQSASGKDVMFITPLMTAAAGETFTFDAWYNMFNNEAKVVVSVSTDRQHWTELRTVLYNELGSERSTFAVTIDQSGDLYLGFKLKYALVDDIYGLTMAEAPEHDWFLTGADIPTQGTRNIDYTATAQLKNISATISEAAGSYTATLYMGTEAIEGEAVAMGINTKTNSYSSSGNNDNTASPTNFTFTFKPHSAGTYTAYIEFKSGDYTVTTDPVEVTIADEAIVSELAIGTPSNSDNNSPLNLNYNNSESVSLYNAQMLASYGLKDGDKIQSITYKAFKTADEKTTVFSAYYEWTDDQTQTQPTEKTAYDTTGMTAIVENEHHTWQQTEGGYGVFEDYLTFTFSEPLVYEEGKSLRLVLRSENDSETNNYASVYFEKGDYGNHYYHRNDSRSDVKVVINDVEVNSKIGIYADWYAGNNPVIHISLLVVPVNVSGLVTDSEGQPIEGATVTAYNAENDVQYQGTTDSDGHYVIDVIQDKLTYVVTATADGYEETSVEGITFTDGSVTQDFTLTEVMPTMVTVMLTADGTSYSGKWALDFSGLDITPFKATQKNANTIHCESVTIVPANTGVIIKGTPGEYQVPTTTEATIDDFTDNLLVANVDETYTVINADEGYVYRYVNKEGTAVFQRAMAGQTVSAGKAYLRLTEASVLDFIGFEDSTTDISLTSHPSSPTSEWYTLDGRKLQGKPTKQGIYIVNGKKVVKK
ncbi:MAG: carboxypeptidase regulatory-like domain-containing protein [Prevotella sp.]|nr:carboxypeptidase regulatory-like domain-containing protein [Prevotella sp.]